MSIKKYDGKERGAKGHYFYNEDFSFLNIPKNASSTLRQLFEFGNNRTKMAGPADETFHRRITFTVIRNPIDRFISGYSEVLKCRNDGPCDYTRSLPFYNMKDPDLKIQRFKTFLSNVEDNLYDEHIKPQVYYLGDVKVDYYLSLENLENDVNAMLVENGFEPLNFERRWNTGLKDKQIYKDFIMSNENILSKIKMMYKDDFELYEK